MSNLLASLRSSASALNAMTQAADVTQNNIANAGTPGYSRQRVSLAARVYDPSGGLSGGVDFRKVESARDIYVERSVRAQNGKATAAETQSTALGRLEQVLQLSAGDSIPSALNKLFAAASAWAVSPDDLSSKQNVVRAGEGVASAFRGVARELDSLSSDNASEIQSVIARVNALASRIREYNGAIRQSSTVGSAIEAGVHATLDEMSSDVDVQAIQQEDGTFTLLLGGERPLVVGVEQYQLHASFEVPEDPLRPGAPPTAVIRLGPDLKDVTSSVNSARLGSLISFRHDTLAGVQGDSTRKGELNQLAEKIVERLNATWPPPATPFFVPGANVTSIAHTVSVNPALQPAMLDAVEPGPPQVANGKALRVAGLANPTLAADKIDGLSFSGFYGRIAGSVGNKLNDAKFNSESQNQLLAQAQAFRDNLSGVSLDEEALHLLEYQRAYEATARMVTVLDEMLKTAVNLGRS